MLILASNMSLYSQKTRKHENIVATLRNPKMLDCGEGAKAPEGAPESQRPRFKTSLPCTLFRLHCSTSKFQLPTFESSSPSPVGGSHYTAEYIRVDPQILYSTHHPVYAETFTRWLLKQSTLEVETLAAAS